MHATSNEHGRNVFGEIRAANLLEAEKLDDRESNGRVEAQPSLVGADGRVELHAVAAIHLRSTQT